MAINTANEQIDNISVGLYSNAEIPVFYVNAATND